jgi:hypothetical protein
MCMSDYRWGLDWEMGFIDHLEVVITSNHSSIANLHTLQIFAVHINSFQSAVTSRYLVTDLNNEILQLPTTPTKSSLHRLP